MLNDKKYKLYYVFIDGEPNITICEADGWTLVGMCKEIVLESAKFVVNEEGFAHIEGYPVSVGDFQSFYGLQLELKPKSDLSVVNEPSVRVEHKELDDSFTHVYNGRTVDCADVVVLRVQDDNTVEVLIP